MGVDLLPSMRHLALHRAICARDFRSTSLRIAFGNHLHDLEGTSIQLPSRQLTQVDVEEHMPKIGSFFRHLQDTLSQGRVNEGTQAEGGPQGLPSGAGPSHALNARGNVASRKGDTTAPRSAVLVWPNGQTSTGRVKPTKSGGAEFEFDAHAARADHAGAPYAQRKRYTWAVDASPTGSPPRLNSLPVVPTEAVGIPADIMKSGEERRVAVKPALPEVSKLTRKRTGGLPGQIKPVVHAYFERAGARALEGKPEPKIGNSKKLRFPVNPDIDVGNKQLQKILARAIDLALAEKPEICADRPAMERASKALKATYRQGLPWLYITPGRTDPHSLIAQVHHSFPESYLHSLAPSRKLRPAAEIEALRIGEHFLLSVIMEEKQKKDVRSHAGMISCTRLDTDKIKVTIINSNHWKDPYFDSVAVHKTMTDEEAANGLEALARKKNWKPRPEDTEFQLNQNWSKSNRLYPLISHLRSMGDARSEIAFHIDRVTPPQKGPDCMLESKFGFLKEVLHPSDYKYVKATVLASAALRVERHSEHPDRQHLAKVLNERATSSLSDFVITRGGGNIPGAAPQGARKPPRRNPA